MMTSYSRLVIATTLITTCCRLGLAEAKKNYPPIDLHPGPHLFLDDYLIQKTDDLRTSIHQPKRFLPGPIVTGKQDQNFQPYMTILRDPKTKRFRIWYDVAVSGGLSHLGYMESGDGMRWLRPHRVLRDPAKIIFGASVLDEGAKYMPAEQRFKLAWWNRGMWLAYSPDGLTWKPARPGPVLKGINDILCITRDPIRNRYLAVFGMPSTKADGYRGKTPNSREGYRRCVGQSTSKDGLKWTTPQRIIKPDAKDQGITEFYSIGGLLGRGNLIIGLLKVLRDDLPADKNGKVAGIGYTVLAWTRDGATWHRHRQPFFDRDPKKGSWDHAMAWMDYQLPVGDEVYLYYGGYAGGHKVNRFTERQIGLVKIQRDRYLSRDAGAKKGILRTHLMTLHGTELTLNADARHGSIRLQILGENGKPIPGFTFKDCTPIQADALAAPVHWKKSLKELRGQKVQLEFVLKKAKLFAMELK